MATHAVNAAEPQGRQRAHKRSATGFIPEGAVDLKEVFPATGDKAAWKAAIGSAEAGLAPTVDAISAGIVKHGVTTLARAAFNMDDLAMYQATALSVRDRLIKLWNDTQTYHTQKKPKRVYYFSLEFLMGKSLDNALLNLDVKNQFDQSLTSLGFSMEDILESERDAGLGNGGLGRLASCYMDSLSTCNIPSWGYGLRYQYGIFAQTLSSNGSQIEVPDQWLSHANPWEIARLDTAVEVKMYGTATRGAGGKGPGKWDGGLDILAVPYDLPIPGWDTKNCNNIRLWSAQPKRAFDLASFNAGDYDASVREAEQAENITRVLYPNENFLAGKELRLKQQYFWVSSSLHDIIRRFKKIGAAWSEFPDYNAIQLNDTHPTMAIVELMRILVDEEAQPWDAAWDIIQRTFAYTNHTVLPEALEKWPVPMIEHILPRHMQIIFDINLFWLQTVEKKYPGDRAKLARVSLIEEGYPQQVRMAYLAVIGSHKVNGVAELHSGLVKEMFADFADIWHDKFTNVTNGITFRRFLLQANPLLAELITKSIGSNKWLKDGYELKKLEKFADDVEFQKNFASIKTANKERLAKYIETNLGIPVNRNALFDVQVKRIHEYKRQTMNILGCIFRYIALKQMSPEDRKKVVPRVHIFAGKAAPGYYIAKLTIRLIVNVSKIVAADPDMDGIFSVVFIPNYSVSLAEIIVPASDISEHISTAGTEASGTSNMKFVLNGGLLLGTLDGANVEIGEEVGDDNIFIFGNLTPDVAKLRRAHHFGETQYPPELLQAVDAVRNNTFGDGGVFEPLLSTLFEGKDYYLISDDFQSYLAAQRLIDMEYVKRQEWTKKTILATSRMGKFSSDRAVMQYVEEVWNVEPVPLP